MNNIFGLFLYKFLKDKYGKDHPEHFEYGAAMKVSRSITWWQALLVVLALFVVTGLLIFFLLYK